MSAPMVCTGCSTPIPAEYFNVADFVACPICNALLLIRAFPALSRTATPGHAGNRITEAGQAACFYHPNKTAHVPCETCGRFVCALCDVELHGQHLCPACIESGLRKGALTTLENRRVHWDNIALWTAVLPVVTALFWFMTVITAPAAILLAVIGWRKPRSLVPRWSKFRFVFAILFSLATLVGWGVLIYFISTQSGVFE
jgi:hypothetical protein